MRREEEKQEHQVSEFTLDRECLTEGIGIRSAELVDRSGKRDYAACPECPDWGCRGNDPAITESGMSCDHSTQTGFGIWIVRMCGDSPVFDIHNICFGHGKALLK
jgi:hypothetical protein